MYDMLEERVTYKALKKLLCEKQDHEVIVELDEYRCINRDVIKRFCDYIAKTDLPFDLKINIIQVLYEPTQYLNEEKAKLLGVNNGMKTSRAIRRILKGYKIDEYELQKFADAINPYEKVAKYSVSIHKRYGSIVIERI